jgi:hypothetical protein
MGPWWFSQFDPAPEVAQAARRSFEVSSINIPSLINVNGCKSLQQDSYLDLLQCFQIGRLIAISHPYRK